MGISQQIKYVLYLMVILSLQSCADSRRIASLEGSINTNRERLNEALKQQSDSKSAISALDNELVPLNKELVSILDEFQSIKKSNPVIAPCIIDSVVTKGAFVSIFGESEADRTIGEIAVAVCGLAAFHDDYPSVRRAITGLNSRIEELTPKRDPLISTKNRHIAFLAKLDSDSVIPQTEKELESLETKLSCENSFFCRIKGSK